MLSAHHRAVLGFCLVNALAAGQLQAGPIQNGAFTPDFAPWQGEVENADFDVTAVDPDTDGRFSLLGGGMAQIQTDPDADPAANIIAVNLFQTFDLSSRAQTLRFDYAWAMSDPDFDYVDAALFSVADPFLFLDLFAAVDTVLPSDSGQLGVDISALAGLEVQLTFRVEDGGDNGMDWLQVGNIELVPAPATLALLTIGLAALRGRRGAPRPMMV